MLGVKVSKRNINKGRLEASQITEVKYFTASTAADNQLGFVKNLSSLKKKNGNLFKGPFFEWIQLSNFLKRRFSIRSSRSR